jgi:hypothetical protein
VKQTNIPNGMLKSLLANIPSREKHSDLFTKLFLHHSRPNGKAARQHQADKGGFPIIESFPGVRIPSFIPSKKLHDYGFFIHLLPGKVKGGLQRLNYEG